MCYSSLHVNRCDPKSDLNSYFRMRLLVCDRKMSLPQLSCLSMPTYRRICIDLLLAMLTEYRFTNSIWTSTPTQLPLFVAICPRRLNRVSRRLKRIGEEETGYYKPFSCDLKDVVIAKWNLLETYRVDHSLWAYILGMTKLNFRISRTKFF